MILKNISLISYLSAKGHKIPHFCYQNDLSIAGNCRLCLIELENSVKPLVSCATESQGVLYDKNFYLESALIKKAQENILEFLLVNHPLDCPICDQGSICDLQDQSKIHGMAKRKFYDFKRTVKSKTVSLLVKKVMTRCIHCTRCIRFDSNTLGNRKLGLLRRGKKSFVGTYVKNKFITSELAGNLIDLCPVGLLFFKWN